MTIGLATRKEAAREEIEAIGREKERRRGRDRERLKRKKEKGGGN